MGGFRRGLGVGSSSADGVTVGGALEVELVAIRRFVAVLDGVIISF